MKQISQETIERAQRIFAMLNYLQIEIDELESNGLFFRQEVKMHGKLFAGTLAKKLKEFYLEMDDEANVYYNKYMIDFEEVIKKHTQNYENKMQQKDLSG